MKYRILLCFDQRPSAPTLARTEDNVFKEKNKAKSSTPMRSAIAPTVKYNFWQ